jgi:peptidoglycan/xylan/chitin deacetylase (PgdA/CDA1 family)
MRGAGASIRSGLGIEGNGVIIDHQLLTFRQGGIQGMLPPVKPEVVRRGNPALKRVAITIDDGWNADMRIIKLFKDKKVPFTAFVIGDRGIADAQPGFVKAMVDAGGQVCSHTLSHYVMRGKSEDFVTTELWKSQQIITDVTHVILPYVRFSGGSYDQPALDWTGREGFWVVNWTIDTADSSAGTPAVDAQVNGVLGNLSNGAIILCHWGGKNTYDVLSRIIPEIRARGYELTDLNGVFEGTPYLLKGTASKAGKK